MYQEGKGTRDGAATEQAEASSTSQPQWGWVTTRETPSHSGYDPEFEMLEIYATVDDANRKIRTLRESVPNFTDEDWEEGTGK